MSWSQRKTLFYWFQIFRLGFIRSWICWNRAQKFSITHFHLTPWLRWFEITWAPQMARIFLTLKQTLLELIYWSRLYTVFIWICCIYFLLWTLHFNIQGISLSFEFPYLFILFCYLGFSLIKSFLEMLFTKVCFSLQLPDLLDFRLKLFFIFLFSILVLFLV